MSSRRVGIVLICEDTLQENFVRHFLKQMGWQTRDFRVEKSPKGKGSGEQWVRLTFPKELKAYRSIKNYLATVLIAVVDADINEFSDRINWMKKVCEDEKLTFRASEETVAILLPKRNIETWICYLNGQPVDEDTDYKTQKEGKNYKPAVNKLAKFCKSTGVREDAPPSLKQACKEYIERIKPIELKIYTEN